MIRLERRRSVARSGQQVDQRAVTDLLEWLQLNPPARVGRRRSDVVSGDHLDQPIQQADAAAAQPLALCEDPVVVERRQEVAAVQGDRRPGRLGKAGRITALDRGIGLVGGGSERRDVDPPGAVVTPPHAGLVDGEDPVGIG